MAQFDQFAPTPEQQADRMAQWIVGRMETDPHSAAEALRQDIYGAPNAALAQRVVDGVINYEAQDSLARGQVFENNNPNTGNNDVFMRSPDLQGGRPLFLGSIPSLEQPVVRLEQQAPLEPQPVFMTPEQQQADLMARYIVGTMEYNPHAAAEWLRKDMYEAPNAVIAQDILNRVVNYQNQDPNVLGKVVEYNSVPGQTDIVMASENPQTGAPTQELIASMQTQIPQYGYDQGLPPPPLGLFVFGQGYGPRFGLDIEFGNRCRGFEAGLDVGGVGLFFGRQMPNWSGRGGYNALPTNVINDVHTTTINNVHNTTINNNSYTSITNNYGAPGHTSGVPIHPFNPTHPVGSARPVGPATRIGGNPITAPRESSAGSSSQLPFVPHQGSNVRSEQPLHVQREGGSGVQNGSNAAESSWQHQQLLNQQHENQLRLQQAQEAQAEANREAAARAAQNHPQETNRPAAPAAAHPLEFQTHSFASPPRQIDDVHSLIKPPAAEKREDEDKDKKKK